MRNWVKVPDDWAYWTFRKNVAVPSNLTADAWTLAMNLGAKHRFVDENIYFIFPTDEEAIMFKLTHL